VALESLTPREASIFACLADAAVAPEPLLPPLRDTGAVAFFDRWLTQSPRRNRLGLRALLYVLELAPLIRGRGARMRRLSAGERRVFLRSLEESGPAQLQQLAKLVEQIAYLAYYGEDEMMLRLGYDPDERLRRGRELREAEARAR
jgi:hypothetical protein